MYSSSTTILPQRLDRGALEAALLNAGVTAIRGTSCRCPFHDDKTASGSIHCKDNIWRFTCHVPTCGFSGDVVDVMARTEGVPSVEVYKRLAAETLPARRPGDAPPARPASSASTRPAQQQPQAKPAQAFPSIEAMLRRYPTAEAHYLYTNPATGIHDLIIIRYRRNDNTKAFCQARPVDGGYAFGAPEKPWPIYNRAALVDSPTVLVVEGEKCVDACSRIGIVATTSPCGAGKAAQADWSPLARKRVTLWPDNDDTGIQHMQQVQAELEKLTPRPTVYVVRVKDLELPKKADVADLIAQWLGNNTDAEAIKGTRDAVNEFISEAESTGGAALVDKLFEDIESGKRVSLDWPFRALTNLTRSLRPGTVTIVCGDPGSSKSFFLLQCAQFWFEMGKQVAIYELEDDKEYHLQRTLSQRAKEAELFNEDWIKANPVKRRMYLDQHRAFLNDFAGCLYEAPSDAVPIRFLADWVVAQCKAGSRIIAIDPITAAERSEKPWEDDLHFMMQVKSALRDYGASLILVSHPKKGRKTGIGFDELAGGAAFQRFAQTILWIESFYPDKSFTIAEPVLGGAAVYTQRLCNRTIHLCKTRNGPGHGLTLAYQFTGRELAFVERGIVTREKPQQGHAQSSGAHVDGKMPAGHYQQQSSLDDEQPF